MEPVLILVCLIIVAATMCCLCWGCCQERSKKNDYNYQQLQSYIGDDVDNLRLECSNYRIKTLDLHNYKLVDAMEAFKTFLHSSISDFKNNKYNRDKRYCKVITGRGNHSPDGEAVIKSSVEKYLNVYNYKFQWCNPGMVIIYLGNR
ncbi:hypothetical protein BsWGS_18290 [Bradybaena similaris]